MANPISAMVLASVNPYELYGASPAGLHARIAELYEYMQAISGEESPDVPGVGRETVVACVRTHAGARAETDRKSEQDWGDLDEVGCSFVRRLIKAVFRFM